MLHVGVGVPQEHERLEVLRVAFEDTLRARGGIVERSGQHQHSSGGELYFGGVRQEIGGADRLRHGASEIAGFLIGQREAITSLAETGVTLERAAVFNDGARVVAFFDVLLPSFEASLRVRGRARTGARERCNQSRGERRRRKLLLHHISLDWRKKGQANVTSTSACP